MREPCPCNGCTERFTACHDRCPKDKRGEYGYKAWKERYQAQEKYAKESGMNTYYPESEAQRKANNRNLRFSVNAYKRRRSPR